LGIFEYLNIQYSIGTYIFTHSEYKPVHP